MDPRIFLDVDNDSPSSSTTQQQRRQDHVIIIRWADMPADAVEGIMKKIGPTADFPRFASACKSWQSVATSRFGRNPRWNKLPWLLLATEDYLGRQHYRSFWRATVRTFYSPSDVSFHEIHVSPGRRCIGSSDGWLVMLGSCPKEAIHVLNPVTRHQFLLPPPSTLKDLYSTSVYFGGSVHKVCLSCSPLSSCECVALTLYSMKSKMAIARPGDKAWRIIVSTMGGKRVVPQWPFENAVYYEGKFYAINSHGEIWRVDPVTGQAMLFVSAPSPWEEKNYYLNQSSLVKSWTHAHYLVESSGDLFYVFRKRIHTGAKAGSVDPSYRTSTFDVLKMRKQDGAVVWEKVTSLANRSFFLGFTVSKVVDATRITDCRRNCIYFTDDNLYHRGGKGTGHDMGFYSLEDDKVYRYKPYVDAIFDDDNISSPSSLVLPDSSSAWTPPVWFFPSLE